MTTTNQLSNEYFELISHQNNQELKHNYRFYQTKYGKHIVLFSEVDGSPLASVCIKTKGNIASGVSDDPRYDFSVNTDSINGVQLVATNFTDSEIVIVAMYVALPNTQPYYDSCNNINCTIDKIVLQPLHTKCLSTDSNQKPLQLDKNLCFNVIPSENCSVRYKSAFTKTFWKVVDCFYLFDTKLTNYIANSTHSTHSTHNNHKWDLYSLYPEENSVHKSRVTYNAEYFRRKSAPGSSEPINKLIELEKRPVETLALEKIPRRGSFPTETSSYFKNTYIPELSSEICIVKTEESPVTFPLYVTVEKQDPSECIRYHETYMRSIQKMKN